jgi:hypothetical protein
MRPQPSHPSLAVVRSVALAAVFATCSAIAQYTEFPSTVAPGSFLLETDAVSLIIDREGQDKFTGLLAGDLLLTTGLTSNWDIQVGAQLYVRQRYESGGFTDRRSGVGDVYVRTKWRFLSNDFVSMAILPYAKIPTNSGAVGNDSVEGGVALPWETYVFGGFLTINSMVDVSRIRNVDDTGYETLVFASASASKEFTRFLTVYAEASASKSRTSYPWQTNVGVGAYVTVSDHLSWDFALYRGLNRNAPDWNPVIRLNYGF